MVHFTPSYELSLHFALPKVDGGINNYRCACIIIALDVESIDIIQAFTHGDNMIFHGQHHALKLL